MKKLDLTNQTFGRLTPIERVQTYISPQGGTSTRWLCKCQCGKEVVVHQASLRCGSTKSCGCLRAEITSQRKLLHGHTIRGPRKHRQVSPEYSCWCRMIGRCENPKNQDYRFYGGRGIRLCDAWRHNFQAFLADVGPRPSPQHSIDRIDVDGHYEPNNCRWATRKEQTLNRRPFKRLPHRCPNCAHEFVPSRETVTFMTIRP